MPKKKWREKALKREWLSQVGTLTGTKLSKLKASMDEYETESAHALELIESFGAFRDVEVSVDDEVYSGDRCDDAPVMRLVRIREFEARLMLQDLRIQEKDGFDKHRKEATAKLKTLSERHARAIAAIKEASKHFKTDIRSLSKTEEEALATHKKAIDAVLEELGAVKDAALALINELLKAKGRGGYTYSQYASQAMPEQAGVWKDRWLETSKAVNQIVGAQWAKFEGSIRGDALAAIQAAIRDGDLLPGADATVGTERWRLDYIGSLAKGVKGPPKQHIAFDPDKFDVDANLEAPSLSTWAVKKGSVADRDRLWGRKDANLRRIGALQSFQDAVHRALSDIPGYDADDPFEVVVVAEVTADDEIYEVVKEHVIALKQMAPATRFSDFLRRPGVRAMLDSDEVPRPDRAGDLLVELELYAGENRFSF